LQAGDTVSDFLGLVGNLSGNLSKKEKTNPAQRKKGPRRRELGVVLGREKVRKKSRENPEQGGDTHILDSKSKISNKEKD